MEYNYLTVLCGQKQLLEQGHTAKWYIDLKLSINVIFCIYHTICKIPVRIDNLLNACSFEMIITLSYFFLGVSMELCMNGEFLQSRVNL